MSFIYCLPRFLRPNIGHIKRTRLPKNMTWDVEIKDVKKDEEKCEDIVAVVSEWIPLKEKLMNCRMENFLLLWFDNQSEQSWENFKLNNKNSNAIKESEISNHKSFVSRAKSIIRNLQTFGLRSGKPMTACGKPKSGESLQLWRKHIEDWYLSISDSLIATLKEKKCLKGNNKKRLTFSQFYTALNKLAKKEKYV